MFNGFSAIERLIKMASAHMPKFEKLIDDAREEYYALRNAARQDTRPDWDYVPDVIDIALKDMFDKNGGADNLPARRERPKE